MPDESLHLIDAEGTRSDGFSPQRVDLLLINEVAIAVRRYRPVNVLVVLVGNAERIRMPLRRFFAALIAQLELLQDVNFPVDVISQSADDG